MEEEFKPLWTKSDELFDLIKQEETITVSDAAKKLEVNENFVRKVAGVLEKNGLVELEVSSVRILIRYIKKEEETTKSPDNFHVEAEKLVHETISEQDSTSSSNKSKK